MQSKSWSYGDKVVHDKRPEWGVGTVTGAAAATHDGKPCQRLTIRFERAGVKTLSTAIADLRNADGGPVLSAESFSVRSDDPFARRGPDPAEAMVALPESATDPFSSAKSRLRATLSLYRFTDSGASLLDWAAAQSGLKDPLSHFNRHELERLFKRFALVRDEHLKKVVAEVRKEDPAYVGQAVVEAPVGAQQVLKRLHSVR